jgi:hypothetical protein
MVQKISARSLKSELGTVKCVACPLILKTDGMIYFTIWGKEHQNLPDYYCEYCFQELANEINQNLPISKFL